jgi:SAM-dependent methyltransferase
MIAQARHLALRSKHVVIAFNIYKNWLARRGMDGREFHRQRTIRSVDGSTHDKQSLAQSLRYIERHLEDYERYAGLTRDRLRGMRVLEIGPGDNLGAGLHLLAAGASRVVCVDKYTIQHDRQKERQIYAALRERLLPEEKRRFDAAISLDDGIEINPEKLHCIYGTGFEEAGELLDGEAFDLIVSRGVLQYLDADATFRAMDAVLAPGGYLLHKIPLDDLGMFSRNGMHPLTFLTIPSSTYRLMTSDVTRPNRKRVEYYWRKMATLGYEARLLVTCLVGEPDEIIPHREKVEYGRADLARSLALVQQIRPRLAPEFRPMPDTDLCIGGIFLVARKP